MRRRMARRAGTTPSPEQFSAFATIQASWLPHRRIPCAASSIKRLAGVLGGDAVWLRHLNQSRPAAVFRSPAATITPRTTVASIAARDIRPVAAERIGSGAVSVRAPELIGSREHHARAGVFFEIGSRRRRRIDGERPSIDVTLLDRRRAVVFLGLSVLRC